MEHDQEALFSNFKSYFDVTLATTRALQEQTFQIRYRVYCEEFGYLSATDYPNNQECDVFDAEAWHCFITHKRDGVAAACVRLVRPSSIQGKLLLPFEQLCAKGLDSAMLEQFNLDRDTIAEISRVAVDSRFRRRSGEQSSRFGDVLDFTLFDSRSCSVLSVAAFCAALALAELTGRTHLFALMEPFLVKLLKRYGLIFQRVGRDSDYYGIRAPYYLTSQAILSALSPELTDFYLWVKRQITLQNEG